MPLKQKKIVITRSLHQADGFYQKLQSLGAVPLLYPCLRMIAPENPAARNHAVAQFKQGYFNWLVLTSQNALESIAHDLQNTLPASLKVAVIGSSTAEAFRAYFGRDIDFIPDTFDSDTLALLFQNVKGQKIFLPKSNLSKPSLKNQLEAWGNEVSDPITYQTGRGIGGIHLLPYLQEGQIDVITFASPSAVTFFLERIHEEGGDINTLAGICIACMGHVTKKAAEESGFQVNVCPTQHTADGLIQAMSEYFS